MWRPGAACANATSRTPARLARHRTAIAAPNHAGAWQSFPTLTAIAMICCPSCCAILYLVTLLLTPPFPFLCSAARAQPTPACSPPTTRCCCSPPWPSTRAWTRARRRRWARSWRRRARPSAWASCGGSCTGCGRRCGGGRGGGRGGGATAGSGRRGEEVAVGPFTPSKERLRHRCAGPDPSNAANHPRLPANGRTMTFVLLPHRLAPSS